MATMIPPELDADARTPRGERELFSALKRDQVVSGTWIAMHSLDIRWHVCKLEGEADFLVMAPGLGVLVVEVKGCLVERKNGRWIYHYEPRKERSESPFAQARSAMHSIRRLLERRGHSDLDERGLKNWEKWVWHSCVVFTEFDFTEPAGRAGLQLEWMPSEVVSSSELTRSGIPTCLANALKARHRELAERRREEERGSLKGQSAAALWYDAEDSRPSVHEVEALAALLRPDLCFQESGGARIRRIEQAIRDATDAQSELALGILDNDRVLIKGSAGTGKTFVALRMAKCLAADGLRVGFFCFNALLGDWLKAHFSQDSQPPAYAGTLSKLMVDMVGRPPADAGREFWATELPDRAVKMLVESNAPPRFDVIFVDEAQDLLSQPFLDVLDLLLVGGLRNGRWIIAGDFSGQAIYAQGAGEEQLLTQLAAKRGTYTTSALRRNCRNAKEIHGGMKALGFARDTETRSLDETTRGTLMPHFVADADAAVRKLGDVLVDLRTRFSPEEIVVLSGKSERSSPSLLAGKSDLPLRKLEGPAPQHGTIGYTTIHAFKGLEAKAVVVIDLASLDGWDEKLLYTGISRGRIEVHLILEIGLRGPFQRRITGQ
ncbi:MAG: NERD domain-containing protein [Xanthomonadales bacterium]|nr:NERD domain-containing protein [Xanthomonadales bacterium]